MLFEVSDYDKKFTEHRPSHSFLAPPKLPEDITDEVVSCTAFILSPSNLSFAFMWA